MGNSMKKPEKIENSKKKPEDKKSSQDYFDSSYQVSQDKNTFVVKGKNAYLMIVLQKDTFKKKSYPSLKKQSITSDLRIAGLYSKKNKNKQRAPKNFTRKMLCYALETLVEQKRITKNNIVSLEADPSPNNNLIKKVYLPMGLKLQQQDDNQSGGVMTASVKTILNWCSNQ